MRPGASLISNPGFALWDQIFAGDTTLTAPTLDRLQRVGASQGGAVVTVLTELALRRALAETARCGDAFARESDTERRREALSMKTPEQMYAPSERLYAGLPDVSYPLHDRELVITACGRICTHRERHQCLARVGRSAGGNQGGGR
jgi:hypothetical protein